MPMNIFVIDYGFGNLHSVQKVMQFIGTDVIITKRADELKYADGVILPGVGAFGDAIKALEELDFVERLKEYAKSGRPLLGICLGMQLLFSYSEEFGCHAGLGLVDGRVVHFPKKEAVNGFNYKIPHVGWNKLFKLSEEKDWKDTILDGIDQDAEVYFVHSFVAVPEDKSVILSYIDYGGVLVVALIKKGNIYGCQFHPEKSRETGIKILQNFVNIVIAYKRDYTRVL